MNAEGTITRLLGELKQGHRTALDALVPLVYDELLELAHRQRLRWGGDHTLDTTALAHEAYLKLVNQDAVVAESRAHFFAIASRAMRHILCNYARDRNTRKRGGGLQRITLADAVHRADAETLTDDDADRLLVLGAALARLEQEHPRRCRVVECRFFGGMSVEDTAAALGISPRTVKRDWAAAQAWLQSEIARGQGVIDERVPSTLPAGQAAGAAGLLDELASGVLPAVLAAVAENPAHDLAPGEHVAHYEITGTLGRGGMGVVYRAFDARLDRHVALKFLSPRLTGDVAARQRFTQEARAASALDHPNICTIYDIGSLDDGRTFLALACYEGRTLRERIGSGGLPLADVVAIARQVADALAAAHDRRIVHRDIKPSNIMITHDGVVKVLDFGIATIRDRDRAAQGATAGTIAYMSPEQTRGDAVDERTDLWSLGVMVHEMLTGRRPFQGDDPQSLLRAIRTAPLPDVAALRADVPPLLQRVIETCLQKDRDARYRSAGDLLADLKVVEAGSGARGVAARRIAVLPLASASAAASASDAVSDAAADRSFSAASAAASADESFLADSVTGELAGLLSKLGGLHVIARASTLLAVARGRSPAEIGAALGVQTIVTGHVAASGDDVAITLELVDTDRTQPGWRARQTVRLTEIESAVRALAWQLAGELAVQVHDDERRQLARRSSESGAAYALYLKGRYFWNKRDRESIEQARTYFQHALDEDPLFARAWAGLADTFSLLGSYLLLPPQEVYPRARAAAERALAIDEELPEAHTSLATVLADYDRDWAAAGRHYRRALELDPGYATARLWYAGFLRDLGRFDAALVQVRAARELDPLSLPTVAAEGTTLYVARRYDEAVSVQRQLLEIDASFGYAHFLMALALVQLRDYDAAMLALAEAERAGAPIPGIRCLTGFIHAGTGRTADARRMIEAIEAVAESPHAHAFQRAVLHAALGEADRALELLEAACDARAKDLRLLRVEPLLDALRGDPRFDALLARAKLSDDDVARALRD